MNADRIKIVIRSAIIVVACIGVYNTIQAELDSANDRVAALEQQNIELREELGSTTDALFVYEVQNEELKKTLSDINERLDDINEQLDRKETDTEEAVLEDVESTLVVYEANISETPITQESADIEEVVASEQLISSTAIDETYTTGVVIPFEEPEQTYEYAGNFELTAYCATGNPCADGQYPSVGYTVASNDSRLWHHWIHIEGYGDYYVHDTGGMPKTVIDVYMGSYNECIQFGRQTADVYIID